LLPSVESTIVKSLSLLSLALLIAIPASARKNNPNLSLEFIPQQTVAASVANISGAMLDRAVALSFIDDRQGESAARVGSRTDDDDNLYDLVATSDVAEFVETHFVENALSWGIDFDPSSSSTLEVRLLEVDIEETNQAVGATYNAKVRLSYSLKVGGEERMASAKWGDATRYGKKFSNANCNEVLSDAMLEAFVEMVNDAALQRAWGE